MSSHEYKAALAAVKIAAQRFAEIDRAWRAARIDDEEYFAARLANDHAEADFDEAYAREEARLQAAAAASQTVTCITDSPGATP